ncbi:hypothetical protein K438DRAFT_1861476 [Mycena galopus ATCC 62051]|nr:hypothetical protein K438DRAFT_1861476 [Mycena galopus ATCC 62051]
MEKVYERGMVLCTYMEVPLCTSMEVLLGVAEKYHTFMGCCCWKSLGNYKIPHGSSSVREKV